MPPQRTHAFHQGSRCFRPDVIFLLLASSMLLSCGGTVPHHADGGRNRFANEPLGDYFVGRRFHLEGTRLWGYLRRPRQGWEKSRLVIMNESIKRQPDRLPEMNLYGKSYGYDHNHEYHIRGKFSGEQIYDPNSNLFVPEFVLTGYVLVNRTGGYLVRPGDMDNKRRLPELW